MNHNTPFRTISILLLLSEVKSPDGIHLQRLKERLLASEPDCGKSISPTLTALKKKGYVNNPLVSMWAITEPGIDHLIELQAQEQQRKEREEAEAAAAAAAADAAAKAEAAHGGQGQVVEVPASMANLIAEAVAEALRSSIERRIDESIALLNKGVSKALAGLGDELRELQAELLRSVVAANHVPSTIIEDQDAGPADAPASTKQETKEEAKRTAAAKKPSILVVGLLGRQMQQVNKRYDRFADIAYIDSQRANVNEIKAASHGRDYVVTMTSFTSHSVEDGVRSATGRPPIRVNGSVSSLLREIDRIVLKHHSQKEIAA